MVNTDEFITQIREHLNERTANIVNKILVGLILVIVIHAVWLMTTTYFNNQKILNSKPAAIHYQSLPVISQFHLFGVYQAINSELLPVTQLNLTLQGIFYAANPEHAQSLIAVEGANAKVYQVGQEVMPGVSVKHILPNEVILDVQGSLQKLLFVRPELQVAPPPIDTLSTSP